MLGRKEQDVPKQSCRAGLEGTVEEPVPTGARNKGFCLTVYLPGPGMVLLVSFNRSLLF